MKRVFSFIAIAALILSMGTAAYAEETTGGDWHVTFTSNEKMVSDFDAVQADKMSEAMYGLQPGDSAIFYMQVKNEHAATTDWYMTNEVLRTLEESQDVSEGGAYTYILTYVGPDGQTNVLYSSDNVGGEDEANVDDRQGLHAATSSLEDFFYLDTLKTGQVGKITLEVALEGETQGNKYQDTMAQLQMNFAVELTQNPGSPTGNKTYYTPIRTGDEAPILLWSAIMTGCGLAALGLAVLSYRRNKEESEDA